MGYVICLLFYKHYFLTALFKYNFYTTEFTCLKHTIQLFLVNLQHCVTITTI